MMVILGYCCYLLFFEKISSYSFGYIRSNGIRTFSPLKTYRFFLIQSHDIQLHSPFPQVLWLFGKQAYLLVICIYYPCH